MNRSHRDRIAFVRVCSGIFARGMTITRAATGRPFATEYAHSIFGQDRSTVDIAYPGDVVGLVNAGDCGQAGRGVVLGDAGTDHTAARAGHHAPGACRTDGAQQPTPGDITAHDRGPASG